MDINQIVTGERLQSIADVYIAESPSCYGYNTWISQHIGKHKYFSDFDNEQLYNNPRVVFCYSRLIKKLSTIIHLFSNPFVLITHNSDENMVPNKPEIDMILNTPNLIRWYSQNVGIIREKLHFLPIGIANRQWGHGNLDVFRNVFTLDLRRIKTKMIYMNFSIDTNLSVRQMCYNKLADKIPFVPFSDFQNHIFRMAEYKFCICPVGNGLDTHRLWECYYLRVVPIMLRNTFSTNIKNNTGLPMVLLDSWDDLCVVTNQGSIIYNLPDYNIFDFDSCSNFLQFSYYIKEITSL